MDQVFGFGQELGETRTEFWRPQVFNRAFRRYLTCAVGRAPLSEVAPIPAILLFLLDSPVESSNLCYLYNKKHVGLKILGENRWKPQGPKVLNCIKLPVFVAIPHWYSNCWMAMWHWRLVAPLYQKSGGSIFDFRLSLNSSGMPGVPIQSMTCVMTSVGKIWKPEMTRFFSNQPLRKGSNFKFRTCWLCV